MSFLISFNALAQSADDIKRAQQQNDRLIQQFQQQQKVDQENLEKQRPSTNFEIKNIPIIKQDDAKNSLCFQIEKIKVKGANVIAKDLHNITQSYQSKCLSLNKINQLVKTITLKYVALGYVTSRAYIPKQDLSTGTLLITVIEGILENFDTKLTPTININTAFPNMLGKILNLRDLEQGIEQLNRLSVNSASMELLPATKVGATTVKLNNALSSPWQSQISIDNSGQETTGEHQAKLFFGFDNVFNLNDYASLTLQNDALNSSSAGDSISTTLRYEIPYGYWLYSLDVNGYDYKNTVQGASTNFESSGKSQQQTLTAKYIWHRDQVKKTDLSIKLVRKKNKNFIEDALLDTSSRVLSILSLTFNQQRFYTGSKSLQWSLGLKHGLPHFGSRESTKNDSEDLDYNALTASINFNTPFSMSKMAFSYASQWSLQFSNDHLYGSEQFSIGSLYSVRGYKGESLSSAKGTYWRHDVSYPIAIQNKYIQTVIPFLGLDVGAIKNEDDKTQDLSGVAIGTKFRGKQLSAELTLAKAVKRPTEFSDEKTQFYFSLSYSL